jgi:hypothetical protein
VATNSGVERAQTLRGHLFAASAASFLASRPAVRPAAAAPIAMAGHTATGNGRRPWPVSIHAAHSNDPATMAAATRPRAGERRRVTSPTTSPTISPRTSPATAGRAPTSSYSPSTSAANAHRAAPKATPATTCRVM